MKNRKSLLILMGLALNAGPAPAQSQTQPSTNSQQQALDMLRQTIYQWEKRRGAVLPPLTNAPARTAPAPAPVRTAPAPTAPVPAPARTSPTFAEIEQQYLLGKITAREFQRYLREHNLEPPKTGTRTNAEALALDILHKESAKKAAEPPKPAPKSETAKPEVARTDRIGAEPDQSAFTEVEKKMDELLRLKAAREKAAQTNQPAETNSTATAAPKTKRQRLDELLKLYIENKIPEAEYNQKRSQIIAEPDK